VKISVNFFYLDEVSVVTTFAASCEEPGWGGGGRNSPNGYSPEWCK